MDSTRRASASDKAPEPRQLAALWRAVRPEPTPHPVDTATLGEFAVLAHRAGLSEAVRAFPDIAAHLQIDQRKVRSERWTRETLVRDVDRQCARCARFLDESLQFAEAEWGPRRLAGLPRPLEGVGAYPPPNLSAQVLAAAPAMLRSAAADYGARQRRSDESRVYEIGASTITLRFGDIVTSQAEVLVSSDDAQLTFGGGVSAAILGATGPQMREEARKLVRTSPPRVGDVIVTLAGNLPAKYVLHAITIGPGARQIGPDAIVRQAVQKAMLLVPLLGCRSVAFPAIGAGVAGIAFDVVAAEMGQALVSALRDSQHGLSVELYLMDVYGGHTPEELFESFERAIQRTLGLVAVPDQQAYRLASPEEPSLGEAQSAAREARGTDSRTRQREIVRMLWHLDRRRSELEAALLSAVVAKEPQDEATLAQIRQQLAEVRALREGYEAELMGVRHATPAAARSVFLSSTWSDLQPHRQALRDLITRLKFRFVGMEGFNPSPEPPAVLIRKKVDEASIYLGVLGMRYGAVDSSSGLSMTELEYRQALASNKHIQMFVMDDMAPITVEMVETDPERYAKLRDFRQRVLQSHVCALFTDVADLLGKAERALQELAAG